MGRFLQEVTPELICRRVSVVRIREKGTQGNENNTGKGPVEGGSLANANGRTRSLRLEAASRRPGAISHERSRGGRPHKEWGRLRTPLNDFNK